MKVYTFKVTVTEEDTPFWDGVKKYETPDNRWVKDEIIGCIADGPGELNNVVVEEIEVKDV
ncbi:MAG: hypothetical protein WCP55_09710 [Lentisphaerota bacterium]